MPEALAKAGLAARGIGVLHQTGETMREAVAARYAELGMDAEVVSFIDDMARAYASATMVVARAGATTLAEVCAIGRPAVLIPFPFAADDHQATNAEALEREGAAICLREDTLSTDLLAAQVAGLLADPDRRRAMADAARRMGRPDAAAAIVDDLCAWLGCVAERGRAPGDDLSDASSADDADDEEGGADLGSRHSLRGSRPYVPRLGARTTVRPGGRRPLVVAAGVE